MMPEEWPIAAPAADRNAPARALGRGRLATVRADFFLNPSERLSEQERALMTAMLHCLVSDLAAEMRAALPSGWVAANDERDAALVDALGRSRLLDRSELVDLLLRRADEERIGTAARARTGRREARVLQGLVSHSSAAVSAAAMALILARGRRRDRFGQCLVDFDDLATETAAYLLDSIAAALRGEIAASRGTAPADSQLSAASATLLSRHDRSRGIDALTATLVRLLSAEDAVSDELLIGAAQEGELAFLAEALASRGGIDSKVAADELLSGDPVRMMALLRICDLSRDVAAGLLAAVGDLLGIADPGAAIGIFDRMSDEQLEAARSWLMTSPGYRLALDALRAARG